MGFWTGLVEGLATLWRRGHDLSVAEREQEMARLQGLLAEVWAQRERETREYAERERIMVEHPATEEGFFPEILEKKLANLKRVREGRLRALEQKHLRHLERLSAERQRKAR